MRSVVVAWFRRDLRLHDNPAWAEASAADGAVALVVLEPALLSAAGPWRREAYLAALRGLDQSLRHAGGALWAVEGDPAEAVARVAVETGACKVVVNADATRWSAARDSTVGETLEAIGVPLVPHWGTVVQPPGAVLTRAGTLSRVFTPFYRRWSQLPLRPAAQPGRAKISKSPGGLGIDDVLADASQRAWSEHEALDRLDEWLARVDRYNDDRDLPAVEGTSGISEALHFGLLSPRHAVERVGDATPGRQGFVRQLAWRDWYTHLTAEHPDIDRRNLRPEYDRIDWATGPQADDDFAAWRDGMTGYPIVDAAMRGLAATGRMHNRLRMIAASFLVKDLLIDWRRGERWFRRMLRDGDIAQNAGNWQWVAGTGPDAAPYFRIFNPVAQSRRFDSQGGYLRSLVPELAGLSDRDVHAPWEATPLELSAAGVVLGVDYPAPIVDHAEARERTLAAYSEALAKRG
ncbi:MAG: deoxyribodipyrimidine photo-lyase [Acidimicrobiaceae bacterium]|nr:deoxyribodipyrimidine photo-lyase [Acidimicrobiaceae bacterium]